MQSNRFDAKPMTQAKVAAQGEAPKVDLEEMAIRSQGVVDAGRYQPADEEGLERLARRYYMSGALPDSYYPGKDVPAEPHPTMPGKTIAARWSQRWIDAGTSKAYIVMLFGAGMGILPSVAIWQIHVINGRPCPSADFMWARLLATGILRRDDFTIEASKTGCKIVIGVKSRPVAERLTVEAKYEDFKHLHNKDNWKNHSEDMLVARAKSRACRRFAPDVFAGVYSAEEMRERPADIAAGVYEVPAEFLPGGNDVPIEPPPVAATEQAQDAPEAPVKPEITREEARALFVEVRKAAGLSPEQIEGLRLRVVKACNCDFYDELVKAWNSNAALGPFEVVS